MLVRMESADHYVEMEALMCGLVLLSVVWHGILR